MRAATKYFIGLLVTKGTNGRLLNKAGYVFHRRICPRVQKGVKQAVYSTPLKINSAVIIGISGAMPAGQGIQALSYFFAYMFDAMKNFPELVIRVSESFAQEKRLGLMLSRLPEVTAKSKQY